MKTNVDHRRQTLYSMEAMTLVWPQESRHQAARNARARPHICVGIGHLVLNRPELVIKIPSRLKHGLADTLNRLIYYPWRRKFSNQLVSTELYLEDLDVDRRNNYAMRLVRRGRPPDDTGKRYDLAQFIFGLAKLPLIFHRIETWDKPLSADDLKVHYGIPDDLQNDSLSPGLIAKLLEAVHLCTVIPIVA